MSPQLVPEIWMKIFSLLNRPEVVPNTSFPDGHHWLKPDGQPDLLSCILVKKDWYNLAAPCLYQAVVTNRLPVFLYGIFNAPIPGVYSKVELLDTVRLLAIVNGPFKPHDGCNPISYEDIMEYGVFGAFTDGREDEDDRRDFQGVRQACELARAWQTLFTKSGRPRGIFQQLERVVTGACSEKLDRIWGSIQGWGEHDTDPADYRTDFGRDLGSRSAGWWNAVLTAQHLLLNFLRHTPSIRHFCQGGSLDSPLSIGFNIIEASGNRPTFATHDWTSCHRLHPIWFGTRSRHYVHGIPDGEEVEAEEDGLSVDQALCARQNAAGLGQLTEGVDWNLQGGLYCLFGQDEDWEEEAKEHRETIARSIDITKEVLPSWLDVAKDHWEVSNVPPPCDACGGKLKTRT